MSPRPRDALRTWYPRPPDRLVLSFDAEHVLVLRCVRRQSLNQLTRLWLGDPLEGLLR